VIDACEAAGAEAAALVTASLRRRIGDLSGQAEAQGGAAPPVMPTVEAMVDDTLLNPSLILILTLSLSLSLALP